MLGRRYRRKKMLEEISRLAKHINERRIALTKALALCRIIDPINLDTKKRLNTMRDPLSLILNNKSLIPLEKRSNL